MAIWHEEKQNCYVVHIDEVEPSERDLDRIRQVLTVAFLHKKYQLVFDLSACQMIDSFFIGLIISTYREVKDLGGDLVVCTDSDEIRQVMEIIRLNKVLTIVSTVDEAIAHYTDSSPESTSNP